MKPKRNEYPDSRKLREALDSVVTGGKCLDKEVLLLLAQDHIHKHTADGNHVMNTSRKVRQYWLAALVPAAALAVALLAGLPGMRSRKSALEAVTLTAEMIIPTSTGWLGNTLSGFTHTSYMDDYIEDLWATGDDEIIF